MLHLAKSEIERKLMTGEVLEWQDTKQKTCTLVLTDPTERRLFAFLREGKVRQPTSLSQEFTDGLSAAYSATVDPSSLNVIPTLTPPSAGPWRLQSMETEGFGGLNIWGGPTFQFSFGRESLLLEGPNGSGKSSFIGALLWALAGERPRDQAGTNGHEPRPVFGVEDELAGNWPPIACYPPLVADLQSAPHVRVQLIFENSDGGVAKIERKVDGDKVITSIDPTLEVPPVLLETGLLMPARLVVLRLDTGGGRLTDAVQKLTGLDDIVAISKLADGLCHKSREYLSYKRKDLTASRRQFDQAIGEARGILAAVQVNVPDFVPRDTDDKKSEMATFGKMLTDRAAELTQVVSNDLAPGLTLTNPVVQHQVISAIGAAREDLNAGLESLPSWKTLKSIALVLDGMAVERLTAAISNARSRSNEAVCLLEQSSKDSKFRLKALAAQWHLEHKTGAIADCPLCEQDLKTVASLAQELESLRSAGDAAAHTFDDNLNAISVEFESSLPEAIRKYGSEILSFDPRSKLLDDLRASFIIRDRYAKTLSKVATLVEDGLVNAPGDELVAAQIPTTPNIPTKLNSRISVIERLMNMAAWYDSHSDQWSTWWQNLAGVGISKNSELTLCMANEATSRQDTHERLSAHLTRLSDALAKAEPYRKAAEAMRIAWKSGKAVSEIEKEVKRRESVAEKLAPLKNLESFAEAIARDTINRLSERISELLKRIHLTDQFQFHQARLHRKQGLVVRGGFVPGLRIDATLVANTSWLRAVLWAFVFALREEAVEQLGRDPFPILVFDDPQSTFDSEHRHRWAQYVASLQSGPSKVQVILTSYDEMFLELVKIDGISGRQAMIAAAGPELGHAGIFEGQSLDRKWSETQTLKTPRGGRDYMSAVRVYVEGLLRLMLRGEGPQVASFVIGDAREKLRQLNSSGIAPWDRAEFKRLVGALNKGLAPIKHIETAHHATGAHLGMSEAVDVEKYWRETLCPALDRGFRLAREHLILHGGLKALHAAAPSVAMPEGHKPSVGTIPLRVLGRAAALSDGRIADGRFDLNEFDSTACTKIILGQHFAYRLTASTLEPVARPGDMLLVKGPGMPSVKSLVVALNGDRILARRFEIAENHTDVAVLTAQAINPRKIAPPVVEHKASLTLHKIVGVLYEEPTWGSYQQSEMEVCECMGEAIFTGLAAGALGLVEVVGRSAEPHALDGQYLIVKKEIAAGEALKALDGKPVIASDTDDNRYFKRLRLAGDRIVLESLDSGGDYGPVVLTLPGKGPLCLERMWPVAGILFELPN